MPKQKIIKGRYKVITPKEWKGTGASATTHLVIDLQDSQRRRVIKELQPRNKDPRLIPHYRERFIQEAKVLEELSQHNSQIPKYYEHFIEKGRFYLVQEYVEGKTLKHLLDEEGVFTEQEVRTLLLEILPVLNYIHQRAIHRDIKPENIIIRERDRKPILIDFGSVKWKLEEEYDSSGNPLYSTVMTGTHGYMPPEQIARRPRDVSDLYALGKTAVQLLTGQHPTRLIQKENGSYDWRRYAPHVSDKFAMVLDKCIQEDWQQRFRSAAEMIAAVKKSLPRPKLRQVAFRRMRSFGKKLARHLLDLAELLVSMKTLGRFAVRAMIGIALLSSIFFFGRAYYKRLPETYMRSGEQSLNERDYNRALQYLNYVIDREPNNARAYFLRGLAQHGQQQYQDASNDFSVYIAARPNDPAGYIARAKSRQFACECKGAELDYTAAIGADRNNAELYIMRATLYSSMSNVAAALQDYNRAIEIDSKNVSLYTARANLYLSDEKPNLAIDDFSRSIELNKNDPDLYFQRATIYYEQGEYANARDDYTAYLKLRPNPAGYYNRALCYYNLGQDKQAIENLDQAISMKNDDPSYYNMRAEVHSTAGNEESAARDRDKASQLDAAKKAQQKETSSPDRANEKDATQRKCGCLPSQSAID